MSKLLKRHQAFYDLHQSGSFIMPNPWDIGSARMMAALGAKALATSSAAQAFTLGRPDMGGVTRDEALSHAADIVAATSLPVSGDLENGFGDSPDDVAKTVRLASEAGLSGCSIEDTQMIAGNPAYSFDLAVERIKAGIDAAKNLKHPFVFCARADGVMNGVYDMDEAIKRLQAFEAAGADLLYAPVVPNQAELQRLLASVSKPINVLAVGFIKDISFAELKEMGVRRISLGSQIARLTHRAIFDSMTEMMDEGRFSTLKNAIDGDTVDALLVNGTDHDI